MRVLPLACAACVALVLAAGARAQIAMISAKSTMADRSAVVIEKASLPGDGFIVVRPQRNGRLLPGVLATVAVRAGAVENLRIPLARPAKPGESLMILLHADYGTKGVFEPGKDPLVLTQDVRAE
jgi:hypothetical protein